MGKRPALFLLIFLLASAVFISGCSSGEKDDKGISGTVAGIVTDSVTGNPIEGVTVSIGTFSAVTDSKGRYGMDSVPDGKKTLTATKDGYQNYSGTVDVFVGEVTIKSFSMTSAAPPEETGTVTGTVTENVMVAGSRATQPISGVSVNIGGLPATTDENGVYTIEDVPAGVEQAVTASKTGYYSYSGKVTVSQGATADCSFQMVPYPEVGSTVPDDGALDVPLDQVITVNFRNNIIQGADFANITLNDGSSNIAFTAGVSGNVLTITPASALAYETVYTVTVPKEAVEGERQLEQDFVFSFTTVPLRCTVTATDPEDDAVGVSLNKVINIDFDMDVADGPGIDNITVRAGLNPSVPLNKDTATTPNRLILTQSMGTFAGNTLYTVTVPADATDPPMATDLVFTFTTTDLILYENFESWPPTGWTIVDDSSLGYVWTSNGSYRSNFTGGTGYCAIADSDHNDAMNTSLITPAMDFSGYTTVTLEFKTDFNHLGETATIFLSTDGGATYPNTLLTWNADMRGPRTQTIDLSAYAGESNVVIRFNYNSPDWYWWWEVDDVMVTGD